MTATTPSTVTAAVALTDAMLARFDERAPLYDREQRFFTEDFLELRVSGFLDLALPAEHGGAGLSLAEIGALQRRLAYHAPATALGVAGHLLWTGLAADLLRSGDSSCAWILERAAAGDVFAAGLGVDAHGVADDPPFRTATRAVRVDGGWELTGQRIACGLAPVWDWLAVHATVTGEPRAVHAFLPRGAGGHRVERSAEQGDDIGLERAFVPDEHVAPAGPSRFAGATRFQVALLAWAMLGLADVHTGIAERAYDLTVADARTGSIAHHPATRQRIAEMRLAVEAGRMVVDRVDADWSAGVDHGADWPVRIVTAKHVAATTARTAVAAAAALGARLLPVPPMDAGSIHELVATISLGV